MQPHLTESDQITEGERVRSERGRPNQREGDQIRGRTTWVARPGACATQAARLARPEVHCGLGGFDFF